MTSLGITGTTNINCSSISTSGTQTYSGETTVDAACGLTASSISFTDKLTVSAPTTITTDAGDNISFVAVEGNSTLETKVGNASFGGTVTGLSSLTTAATATFGANVSGVGSISAADSIINCASISTSGVQSYSGETTVGAECGITAGSVSFGNTLTVSAPTTIQTGAGNNISFAAITGTSALETKVGNASFGGTVTGLSSLTTAATATFGANVSGVGSISSGSAQINCSSISTSGAQTYSGETTVGAECGITAASVSFGNKLTVSAPTTITTAAGDNISFAAVEGTSTLETKVGNASFGGTVTGLSSLTTEATATFEENVSGVGSISTAAVTLGADLVEFSASSISVTGAIGDNTKSLKLTSPSITISNNISVKNLSVINITSDDYTLTFNGSNQTVTVADTLTLKGNLDANGTDKHYIVIESSEVWNLACDPSKSVIEYINVKNSAKTGDMIAAYNSLDSGNNTNWTFPGFTYKWTGNDSTTPHKWDDADNWYPKSIPNIGALVEIPKGLTNYPVITTETITLYKDSTYPGSVTIEKGTTTPAAVDAELTISGGSLSVGTLENNGKVTVSGGTITTDNKFSNNNLITISGTTAGINASALTKNENGNDSAVVYTGTGAASPVWGTKYKTLTVESGTQVTLGNDTEVQTLLTNAGTITNNAVLSVKDLDSSGTINGSGNQSYTGTVTLSGATTLTSTGDEGTIGFSAASPIDGNTSLTLQASTVTFGAPVGNTTQLTSLGITGTTNISCSSISTSGVQTYSGETTVGAECGITAGSVNFGNTLTVSAPTTITTASGDNISFAAITGTSTLETKVGNANFGGTVTGLSSLTTAATATFEANVSGVGSISTADAIIKSASISTTWTGTQTYSGTVQFDSTNIGDTGFALSAQTITFNNNVSVSPYEKLLTLTGNVETDGADPMTVGLPLQVNGNLTNKKNTTFSKDINITGVLTNESAGTLYATNIQTVTAAIAGSVEAASIIVSGTSDVTGSVKTTGNQTYTGNAIISDFTIVDVAQVQFGGIVTGKNGTNKKLTITKATGTTFDKHVTLNTIADTADSGTITFNAGGNIANAFTRTAGETFVSGVLTCEAAVSLKAVTINADGTEIKGTSITTGVINANTADNLNLTLTSTGGTFETGNVGSPNAFKKVIYSTGTGTADLVYNTTDSDINVYATEIEFTSNGNITVSDLIQSGKTTVKTSKTITLENIQTNELVFANTNQTDTVVNLNGNINVQKESNNLQISAKTINVTGTVTVPAASSTITLSSANNSAVNFTGTTDSSFSGKSLTVTGNLVSAKTSPANQTFSLPVIVSGNLTNSGISVFSGDVSVTGNVKDSGTWTQTLNSLIFTGGNTQEFEPNGGTVYHSVKVLKTGGSFATKTNAFKAQNFTDWTEEPVTNAGTIIFNTDTTIQSDVELKTVAAVTFAAAKNFTFKDTSDAYKDFKHTTGNTDINGNVYAKDISLKTVTGTNFTVKQAEDITVSETANLTAITIENASTTTFTGIATITTFSDTETAGSITFNAGGTIANTTTFATTSLVTFGNDATASFTFGTSPNYKNLIHIAYDTKVRGTLTAANIDLTNLDISGTVNGTTRIGGNVDVTTLATFKDDVYLYGNVAANFGTAGQNIKIEKNLVSARDGALTIDSNLTVTENIIVTKGSTTAGGITSTAPVTAQQNIVLYNGDFTANDALSAAKDILILGEHYSEEDATTGLQNEYSYYIARPAAWSTPNYTAATLPDGTALPAATSYNATLAVASGTTISAGKNFYANGTTLSRATAFSSGTWLSSCAFTPIPKRNSTRHTSARL